MSNIWLVLSAKRPRGCELIKSSQCFHIVGILTQLTIISYNLQLHPPFLQLGVVYAVFHHPHLWPLVRHADRLAHKVTSPTSTQRTSLGPIRLDISCFFDFPEQTAGDPKKREPLERNEMIWSGLLLSPQSVKSNHHWQSLGSSFRIENIFQNQIMCSSPSITAWFWHIHIYLFFWVALNIWPAPVLHDQSWMTMAATHFAGATKASSSLRVPYITELSKKASLTQKPWQKHTTELEYQAK